MYPRYNHGPQRNANFYHNVIHDMNNNSQHYQPHHLQNYTSHSQTSQKHTARNNYNVNDNNDRYSYHHNHNYNYDTTQTMTSPTQHSPLDSRTSNYTQEYKTNIVSMGQLQAQQAGWNSSKRQKKDEKSKKVDVVISTNSTVLNQYSKIMIENIVKSIVHSQNSDNDYQSQFQSQENDVWVVNVEKTPNNGIKLLFGICEDIDFVCTRYKKKFQINSNLITLTDTTSSISNSTDIGSYNNINSHGYGKNVAIDVILPNDIIIKIIKYLDTIHLQFLPLLSKSWKLLIYNNLNIFKHVC